MKNIIFNYYWEIIVCSINKQVNTENEVPKKYNLKSCLIVFSCEVLSIYLCTRNKQQQLCIPQLAQVTVLRCMVDLIHQFAQLLIVIKK